MILTNFTALLATVEQGYVLRFNVDFLYEVLFQWVNTAILIAFLAWILYNPVKKFLFNRSERIRRQLEEAEENRRDAVSMKAEYEQKRSNIEGERVEILTAARQDMKEKESRVIMDAKAEADAIVRKARQDADLERERLQDDIKTRIIEVSELMARRYIETNIDENAQYKLIDDVIGQLEGEQWHNPQQ